MLAVRPSVAPPSLRLNRARSFPPNHPGNWGKASDKKAKAPRALDERDWNKRYGGSIGPATEADPLASNPAKLGQPRVDFQNHTRFKNQPPGRWWWWLGPVGGGMSVVEALKGFRAELAETPAGLPRVRRAAKLSLLCAKELLGTAALAPFALRAQLTHRGLLRRRRHHALHGVAYGPAQRQLMDVYFPVDGGGAAGAEGKGGAPSPVAVFVHGGVWSSGEAWHYAPLGAQLAEEGVVCFVPTYSLYPSATVDKQVVEVGQALDFAFQTAEQFGGDPENVTLLGHSAGAQLGLLEVLYRAGLGKGKGRRSSRKQPRKFVGMAGCYDIRKHWWYEHGRGVHRLSTMERAFGGRDRFHMLSPACLLQDTVQDQFTPDARAGPPLEGELEGRALAWVAHIAEEQRNLPSGALPSSLGGHPYAAPMPDCFLLAGLMDQTVPWAWSTDMHAKLNRAGVRSENLVYDQAGHGDFVVGWGHGSGPRTPPYVADALKIIKRAG